jgi:hypothetical protein
VPIRSHSRARNREPSEEYDCVGAGRAAEGTEPADEWSWSVQGEPRVFAPFLADTDYWAADKQFMLNLRVRVLDSLLERLTASGTGVTLKPESDSAEAGRFARIHDPEGNGIELWEPLYRLETAESFKSKQLTGCRWVANA